MVVILSNDILALRTGILLFLNDLSTLIDGQTALEFVLLNPINLQAMAKIQVLPSSLINQIAAGEVIERPASVVKELLENSIDAGTSEIICEIVGGGLEAIIIADNGCGMFESDAKMAFARHATSKIATEDDLNKIGTLGFRGEALASIASVSRVEMETKMRDEISGFHLKIKDENISMEDAGCPEGTKISIFNLFYNTPARRKYMKTANTEYKYILELMQNFALAYPDVAFKLINDGKVAIDVAPGDLEDRIADVAGGEVANNLVPVYFGGAGFKISGFIGKPAIARSNRKGQLLFLNGRVIQNHLIAHAAREAYHSLLMGGKYPWFLLNLEINSEDVDVNVHPRKLEVRFLKQNEVYRSVLKSVKEALDKHLLMPKVSWDDEIDREPRGILEKIETDNRAESFEIFKSQVRSTQYQVDGECPLRPIAQIAESYILAEDEEGLVIIDQHAAHERVMYHKLMLALEEKKVVSQPMLAPLSVDLGLTEAETLRGNMDFFSEIGFEIDEFGGNTFVVGAVPSDVAKEDAGELLQGVLDDIMNCQRTSDLQARRENAIHYMACRSAVKFGQKLSFEEMKGLIAQLFEIERNETCPHGRPTMIRVSYDDLERKFKRRP